MEVTLRVDAVGNRPVHHLQMLADDFDARLVIHGAVDQLFFQANPILSPALSIRTTACPPEASAG